MMTNNMPETMKKHQKNWGKNWEKVRKRSKQCYEDKKKGYIKGIYLKKKKKKKTKKILKFIQKKYIWTGQTKKQRLQERMQNKFIQQCV